MYYVSNRYYDPEIGRWINDDIPETITADFENFAQYNLFAYCFNNPVNLSDETGTWPRWATKLAIGAVDGFTSGFMTGGIMAGGSQILSSGFKIAANAGVPTGRNGGRTIGNKVRVLSPNHPQGREIGGTLLKIGSKYKNIRFDVGSKSMFHMNVQLSKKINLHLPLGMVGSGLWGGMMRD